MTAQEERARWTIQEAERLLLSLQGVLSARVVARPGGDVDEIHLLTTADVKPKQTVRNVESALLAHLDLPVDHRKISVAQTTSLDDIPAPAAEAEPAVHILPVADAPSSRLLFYGHQVETERSNRVRHRVEVEWRDEVYVGEATATDLPRARLEAVAQATIQAVEQAMRKALGEDSRREVTLELDGVKIVDAFDRKFVLVAVHAISGRDVTSLAASTVVNESPDRAAILATLRATDRWARGQI